MLYEAGEIVQGVYPARRSAWFTFSEALTEHCRMWSQTPSSTSQALPRTKKKSAITRSYQDKKIALRLAPSGTLEK